MERTIVFGGNQADWVRSIVVSFKLNDPAVSNERSTLAGSRESVRRMQRRPSLAPDKVKVPTNETALNLPREERLSTVQCFHHPFLPY